MKNNILAFVIISAISIAAGAAAQKSSNVAAPPPLLSSNAPPEIEVSLKMRTNNVYEIKTPRGHHSSSRTAPTLCWWWSPTPLHPR